MHLDNNFAQVITNPFLAYLAELIGIAERRMDIGRRTIRPNTNSRSNVYYWAGYACLEPVEAARQIKLSDVALHRLF